MGRTPDSYRLYREKMGGATKILRRMNHAALTVKSHSRSTYNKTDAMCFVKCDSDNTPYAKTIQNRKTRALLPIIMSYVKHDSIIHIDKHERYKTSLKKWG